MSSRIEEANGAVLAEGLCAVVHTMLQSRSWASSEGGVEGRCLASAEGAEKEAVDGEKSIVEDASADRCTAAEVEEA